MNKLELLRNLAEILKNLGCTDLQARNTLYDVYGMVTKGHKEMSEFTQLAEIVRTVYFGKSITCPKCLLTSHHPNDVKESYCDNCHEFTGVSEPPTTDPLSSR